MHRVAPGLEVRAHAVGTGAIARALLDQLKNQAQALRERYNVVLSVRGVANSRYMYLNDSGIDLDSWLSSSRGLPTSSSSSSLQDEAKDEGTVICMPAPPSGSETPSPPGVPLPLSPKQKTEHTSDLDPAPCR